MPHKRTIYMKYRTNLVILFLSFFWEFNLVAQNSTINDSLIIGRTVNEFFAWYINAIKQKSYSEFQPTFVESSSGMTTLNYTKYVNNLNKFGFSDSLITKEVSFYKHCVDELEKVKYSEFNTQFIDLDDFENIECDFGNYYRWIGGQEPIDGIRILTVKFINSSSASVNIDYYDFNSEDNRNIYWGNNWVTMIRVNNTWKINNINWR